MLAAGAYICALRTHSGEDETDRGIVDELATLIDCASDEIDSCVEAFYGSEQPTKITSESPTNVRDANSVFSK